MDMDPEVVIEELPAEKVPYEEYRKPEFIEGYILERMAKAHHDLAMHVGRLTTEHMSTMALDFEEMGYSLELGKYESAVDIGEQGDTSEAAITILRRKLDALVQSMVYEYSSMVFAVMDHERCPRVHSGGEIFMDVVDLMETMQSDQKVTDPPAEIWMHPEQKRKLYDQLVNKTISSALKSDKLVNLVSALKDLCEGYSQIMGLRIISSPMMINGKAFILCGGEQPLVEYHKPDESEAKSGVFNMAIEGDELRVWRNMAFHVYAPHKIGVIEF